MKIHNLVINIFADNFHVKFPSSLSRSQMGRLLRIDEDWSKENKLKDIEKRELWNIFQFHPTR